MNRNQLLVVVVTLLALSAIACRDDSTQESSTDDAASKHDDDSSRDILPRAESEVVQPSTEAGNKRDVSEAPASEPRLTDGDTLRVCANGLAYRPAMRAYLVPASVYPVRFNSTTVVLNEGLERLFEKCEEIKAIPCMMELNAKSLVEFGSVLKKNGLDGYSKEHLYILNWSGERILGRSYIDKHASPEVVEHAKKNATAHISEIFPDERQLALIDIAKQLEAHPTVDAHLLAGLRTDKDGSRMIRTIWNSAARKIHKGAKYNLPHGQVTMDMNKEGLEIIDKRLRSIGIEDGYQDDTFYQLNWELTISGRDKIISMGRQIEGEKKQAHHFSLSAPPVSSWIPPSPMEPMESFLSISPYLDECYEVPCSVKERRSGQELPIYHITADGKRGPRVGATKLLDDMGKDSGYTQVSMGGQSAHVQLYQTTFVDGRVDLIGVEYSGLVIFWKAQNGEDVTYTLNLRESAADIRAAGVNLDVILAKFPEMGSTLSDTLAMRIGKSRETGEQHTFDLVGAAVHLGEREGTIQGRKIKYYLLAHITKDGELLVSGDKDTGLVGVNEGGQVVTFLQTREAIVGEEGPDGKTVLRTYDYDERYNLRGRSPEGSR